MKAGDVIAFGGHDFISTTIKIITLSSVSHVGIAINSDEIIESAVTSSQVGVKINNLGGRLANYRGNMWCLSLLPALAQPAKIIELTDYLLEQQGKIYDISQAIEAGLAKWIPYLKDKIKQDHNRLFCSELIASGFVAIGLLPTINYSLVTPRDIVSFKLYENKIIPLKGNTKLFPFNNNVIHRL